MKDIFITNITINNVRHLSGINISLSNDERKHLIFTGKNGSGKTSVLEAIKKYLIYAIENKQFNTILTTQNLENKIEELFPVINNNDKEKGKSLSVFKTQQIIQLNNRISLHFTDYTNIIPLYEQGKFIITYYNAKRTDKINIPKGIEKFEIQKNYKQTERINQHFLQHIVNLKAERSFARDDNDFKAIKAIDQWFENFENWLKIIFDDKNLELKFDRKNYSFDIVLSDNIVVNFNILSDGYSALLNIVMELMMRMESKTSKIYDIQGIVLIDEIETHLHIDLQKKVLPFLTTVFPNIQFIVTTHSPFVLNSIENAVIYDLEKRLQVEDLSAYAVDGIVEGYFDNDKYSDIVKNKIKRYENLVKNKNKSDIEWETMVELKQYLKTVPAQLAPELVAEFLRIENERLTVNLH